MTNRSDSTGGPTCNLLTTNEMFAYTGRELEAMSWASNYHRWILRIFLPYLGQHIVEVGAGFGSFSELILSEHKFQRLSLVEPSQELYARLCARMEELRTNIKVHLYNGRFLEAAPLIKAEQSVDSIIYINVLEHVADDEKELDAVGATLSEGGCVFLFVPALRWLYGTFDRQAGHFRRYMKPEIDEKLRRAGFRIIRSSYFDFPGIVPWWFKYRLMKSQTMERGAVRFYDRFIVPAVRRIESITPPPIGKNIVLIAQKR